MDAPFLAVDWGTTNRRAYLVGADGRHGAEHEDDRGVMSVGAGGFEAAIGELRARYGDVPMLLAGMVGSNRGWVDAGYVACPADLEAVAKALNWIEPGRVAIVPGLSLSDAPHFDVMRGEEVQILGGVAAGLLPPDGLVCHPGTHTKWIELERGCVQRFRTVMTGELFGLLKAHSILSDLLAGDAPVGEAFARGVDHGVARDDLTAELFQVRARVLLGAAEKAEAASYVSGLLIGNDLRTGFGRQRHDSVFVVGRPELTERYAAAIRQSGRVATEVDGEATFVAGMVRIWGMAS